MDPFPCRDAVLKIAASAQAAAQIEAVARNAVGACWRIGSREVVHAGDVFVLSGDAADVVCLAHPMDVTGAEVVGKTERIGSHPSFYGQYPGGRYAQCSVAGNFDVLAVAIEDGCAIAVQEGGGTVAADC